MAASSAIAGREFMAPLEARSEKGRCRKKFLRQVGILSFCLLFVAVAGIAGPGMDYGIRNLREDAHEKIDNIPKLIIRPKKAFLPTNRARMHAWTDVPKLSQHIKDGFMNPALWRDIAKIQNKSLNEDIIHKPSSMLPSEKGFNKDDLDFMPDHEIDYIEEGEKLVLSNGAKVLFDPRHPLITLPRKLTSYECLQIINRTAKHSMGVPAASVILFMRSHKIERTVAHYWEPLLSAAMSGRPDVTETLLQWMESDGFGPPAIAQGCHVLALGMYGSLDNATRVFEIMKATTGQTTLEAYHGLLAGCVDEGLVDHSDAIIAEKIASGYPDDPLSRSLQLKILANGGRPERIEALLARAPEDFDGNPEAWYHALIMGYANAGDSAGAVEAWRRARGIPALARSTKLHNVALEALGGLGATHSLTEVFQSMKMPGSGSPSPNDRSGARRKSRDRRNGLESNGASVYGHDTAGAYAICDTRSFELAVEGFCRAREYPCADLLLGEMRKRDLELSDALVHKVEEGMWSFHAAVESAFPSEFTPAMIKRGIDPVDKHIFLPMSRRGGPDWTGMSIHEATFETLQGRVQREIKQKRLGAANRGDFEVLLSSLRDRPDDTAKMLHAAFARELGLGEFEPAGKHGVMVPSDFSIIGETKRLGTNKNSKILSAKQIAKLKKKKRKRRVASN